MSVGAAPAGGWHTKGVSGLIGLLRDRGYKVSTAEAIDATRLVLVLAATDPEGNDPARLRARLCPVLCKSPDEQHRFDDVFKEWWATVSDAPPPPLPPSPPPRPPVRPPDGSWRAAVMATLLTGGLLSLLYVSWSDWSDELTRPPVARAKKAAVGPGTGPSLSAPGETAVQAASTGVDRFVPGFRHDAELKPGLVWGLVLLPLIAFLGVTVPALVLTRTRLRRRGDPMYLDPAPLETQARRLVPPMSLEIGDRLARHVRSRGLDIERLARRPVLDVRGTLEATIRNYGIPTLRFSHSRVYPAYLVLIDVANEKDPRGRLFFQWAERMQRENLKIEMRLIKRAEDATDAADVLVGPSGPASREARNWRPLSQLRGPIFGERLIVVSDGDPLADKEGNWRKSAQRARFSRWRDRTMFTPVEPRDWADRELAIERAENDADPGFIVLPLEESALGAWTDLVLSGKLTAITLSAPQRYPAVLRNEEIDLRSDGEAPSREIVEKLIAQLRIYLDDEGFYWLAACAVAPLMRWELTLLIGMESLKDWPHLAQERALNEAIALNYKRLARLPWVQRATMPEWLRLRLLLELPETRQIDLRDRIARLLEQLPRQGSPDAIELEFERPPGGDGGRSAPPPRPGRDDDTLYLGYMSGVMPEQLVLRAPPAWAAWIRSMPADAAGLRGRLASLRERSRAWWARLAWTRGLPHLGFSRRSVVVAALLTTPLLLLILLAAIPGARTQLPELETWLFGNEPRLLAWPSEPTVSSAAFSPDGTLLATVSLEGVIRVWNAQTGLPVGRPLTVHPDSVGSMAFGPTGAQLAATGRFGGQVHLWDLSRGEHRILTSIPEAPSPRRTRFAFPGLSSIAYSPDGNRIAAGSDNFMVWVWDVSTGAFRRFEGHSDRVESVAFSPDGKQIVSGDGEGIVKLWDAATEILIRTLDARPTPVGGSRRVRSLAFSPNGQRIAAGSENGVIRLWNTATGNLLFEPLHIDFPVRSVAFSRDGSRLVSGADAVHVWNANTGEPVGVPLAGHNNAFVASVTFRTDGTRLMSVAHDGMVRTWKAYAAESMGRVVPAVTGSTLTIAFSPDSTRLVSGGSDGTLHLWDARTGNPIGRPFAAHSNNVWGLAFDPTGTRIVSGSMDGTVRFWNASSGTAIGEPAQAAKEGVGSVAYSRNGRLVAIGAGDGKVLLWDARTVRPVRTLEGHTGQVNGLAFGTGFLLVSASLDGTIRRWDVTAGVPVGEPLSHGREVIGVAVSPDGALIASAGTDATVRLWNASTGAQVHELKGHSGNVSGVAFSPDGRRIVSRSVDRTIRIWDVATGEPVGSPLPASPDGIDIAWSPDGRTIATVAQIDGAADAQKQQAGPIPTGGVQLWRVDPATSPSIAGNPRGLEYKLRHAAESMRAETAALAVVLALAAIIAGRTWRSRRRIEAAIARATRT